LQEVEKTMETEVLPVWNYMNNKKINNIEKQKAILNIKSSINKYNQLAKEIFGKYLP
jgi:hypothetical protein